MLHQQRMAWNVDQKIYRKSNSCCSNFSMSFIKYVKFSLK